ncbi:potassium channel family protein [bacterium]|nr:potassium channel family protein [bacterium]
MQILTSGLRFNKIILNLIFSHSFFIVTVIGNLIIIGFSTIFYYIERVENVQVSSLYDAIWWGFSTATTVGYGDIIPHTGGGRLLGIVLMLTGTALFATYTALFAQTILEDEFLKFRKNKKTDPSELIKDLKEQRDLIDKQIESLKS